MATTTTKRISDLLPGDILTGAPRAFTGSSQVRAIQNLGAFTIIDFTDSTATAPAPSGATVKILLASNGETHGEGKARAAAEKQAAQDELYAQLIDYTYLCNQPKPAAA